MPTYIDAIAAQNFRGIGSRKEFAGPFSDINFFIGANNSGKSIILKIIHEHLPFGANPAQTQPLSPADIHRPEGGQFRVLTGVSLDVALPKILELTKGQENGRLKEIFEKLVPLLARDSMLWLSPEFNGNPSLDLAYQSGELDNLLARDEWYFAWQMITRISGGDLRTHWIPQTLERLALSIRPSYPDRLLIPAKREIGPRGEAFEDLTGKGLIDHLADLQNPDFDKRDERDKFDSINGFLQSVVGKPDARLEVPNNKAHILIHMDNKVLPLSSLGTGIHEVILIAAFCTIHQNKILCIEEPEIHLHPILQRKLIDYIGDKTSNQYFIATHSASFIDKYGSSVFHVRNDGIRTSIQPAITRKSARSLIDDLGYRASDILQSNAVIWVEGPSDRIYIRHWISSLNSSLREGIDYSIMFYGGGLIRHISTDDMALEEFIRIQELNKNMAIVIDSDRTSPRAPLKPAVQRLRAELTDGRGLIWITKGREVENYVQPAKLHSALKRLHPQIYSAALDTGPYDHSFYFRRTKPTKSGDWIHRDGDKVGAAALVCEDKADLSILDLEERARELVSFIQRANSS